MLWGMTNYAEANPYLERTTDNSPTSIVDRVHELVSAGVRTHPNLEARLALRDALAELEGLRDRMIRDESLRD